ncbi:MAG: HPr(Ser) kinase/phosphatase [Clostridia bacterium]|nr:HPr(Ser) kinase/phosphatase [Clostridia bacterium]MBR2735605.1 HPr(Ser) kinase/phosphatase [Clostridia bacterium]
MNQDFFVTLEDLIRELSFEIALMPVEPRTVKIASRNINRMGLELIGPIEHFDNKRIMVMGESESYFLSTMTTDEIYKSLEAVLSLRPPLLIVSYGIKPTKEIIDVATKYSIPVLTSKDPAADVTAELTPFLNIHLAPRITRSGGLMNVHGEGILLVGKSGVGKSETAVELLKRGHKLVADDLVEIRKIPKNNLVGSAPENIRHFIEVRGIGIINARRIFGIGAVKLTETIDMVVNLETWDDSKDYDRMGAECRYTEILGVKVPYMNIPVRPGRNLAVIIEVAAMNNRQRKMGYNAARELFINLGMEYPNTTESDKIEKCIWDI